MNLHLVPPPLQVGDTVMVPAWVAVKKRQATIQIIEGLNARVKRIGVKGTIWFRLCDLRRPEPRTRGRR